MSDDERAEMVPAASAPLGRTMMEGDPEQELALLERKAALATRMRDAMDQILISNTYPEDWSFQGAGKAQRACLGSAGAERVGRLFAIEFEDVRVTREEIHDA